MVRVYGFCSDWGIETEDWRLVIMEENRFRFISIFFKTILGSHGGGKKKGIPAKIWAYNVTKGYPLVYKQNKCAKKI